MVKRKARPIIKFEPDLVKKANILKKYYDIQSNAELVSVLVNEKTQQLIVEPIEVTSNGS
jgi:hypothetical protein